MLAKSNIYMNQKRLSFILAEIKDALPVKRRTPEMWESGRGFQEVSTNNAE